MLKTGCGVAIGIIMAVIFLLLLIAFLSEPALYY